MGQIVFEQIGFWLFWGGPGEFQKLQEACRNDFLSFSSHSDFMVPSYFRKPIVLTTEEEGIAFSSGAWLGGKKSVLLMQSSGVGNCINMLSILSNCNFPFVTLITMRGEFGEFNSWQVPMGQATQTCLESMGVVVHRASNSSEVENFTDAALYSAFSSDQQIAVLLSQKLIGRKEW